MNVRALEICGRLRELRLKTFGPRGKAQFARRLGIGASTYQQYETTRTPPVDLLVRAADTTGCDLIWLLTGAGTQSKRPGSPDDLVVERVRELLLRRPETSRSLSAFLMLIDPRGSRSEEPIEPTFARPHVHAGQDPGARLPIVRAELVPVIGSTAAGPARFWSELWSSEQKNETPGNDANSRLQQLLDECKERYRSAKGRLVRDVSDPEPDSTVALIQFSRPDDAGIVEFLSCPGLAERPIRLFAWRIDGGSMTPRYRDGDFVLVSPDEPAIDGHPCVAHQRGQIGVNCKIFKRDKNEDVLLVPLNESFPPQRFAATELIWANRVLYSVRLTSRGIAKP